MMRYVLGLALIVVGFVSCTPMSRVITDPSERLTKVSGVSVLPPQEPDWHLVALTQTFLGLAKRSQTDGEVYGARVGLYELPDLTTEQDLLKFFSDAHVANAPEPQTRTRSLTREENPVRSRGAMCIHYHEVTEDHEVLGAFMILEEFGYLCQHPKNKRIGVRMEYSHHHLQGRYNEPGLETKAKAFLDHVQFTDF